MGNVCLRRNYHPHLLNKTANARELPPSLKDTAGRPGSRKTIYIRILKWNVIKIRSFDSPAFKFFFFHRLFGSEVVSKQLAKLSFLELY